MAAELWQASAIELAAGLRARQFSGVAVMTSVVARIGVLKPTLHAIVVDRSEPALAEAVAGDRAPAGSSPGRSAAGQ
jgi:Asp-tRNA(Asn)/Glu-tRNA(Gln) amidotransferase A subunit family amidase